MTDITREVTPRVLGRPAKETMKSIPAGLWQKCPKCRAMLYTKDLERNLRVCHHCQYHFMLSSEERIALLADPNSFVEIDAALLPTDPLEFPDYGPKLAIDRNKTGRNEAFLYGDATIDGIPAVLGIEDFAFRAGSMGSVVGEKVARTLERGAELTRPVVIVTASGGARMQEGMLSLMQMAKTSAACMKLREARQLYIVVMTDPTTAGVLASFASLGDIIIAEPGARIRFAGSRVVEQNSKVKQAPTTLNAEFQLEHGMIDMIVHRREMRATIAKLLAYLAPVARTADAPVTIGAS